MQNLNLKFVYKSLTDKEKDAVINLWTSCGVVSQQEALKRIDQVSVLILDEENVVGVSTIYENDFTTPNNLYFFFRMYIKDEYRGSNSLRSKVMVLNFHELKKIYESRVHGIVLELENTKLARLGEKTNYMQKRGYTYYGKSPRGLQLWYVRFDEPKGIYKKDFLS